MFIVLCRVNEFEIYLSQKLAPRSVELITTKVRQLLEYLEKTKVMDLKNLTSDELKRFIISESPRLTNSMKNLLWALKRFVLFLDDIGLVKIKTNSVFINSTPKRTKVLPCFTTEEADAIFAAVDTSTFLGKRDYAILKIAIGTGLRGVDICAMQLSDIDWRKNEIRIVQRKTGGHIILPLMPEVGNAIADYLLNARPQADTPYVFLRCKRPHNWLGNSRIGVSIMERYQKKAGVSHKNGDGKTFHAFRRTIGTRLIKAEVPLPSAAQILGHKRIESAKQYIVLNDDSLCVCCMDISNYTTKKEGLI